MNGCLMICFAVAKRFADDFGVVRLSIGEAIRNILANQPRTELAKCIQLYLYQGLTVPDECAVQALDVYLMDVQCQTRGSVSAGRSFIHEYLVGGMFSV